MANTLGDMVVRIVGDTSGFEKSVDGAQKSFTKFGIGAAAAVAAAVAVGKAIFDAGKKFADFGSEIYDASQKTGLSTDAIQEWKYIAEQTGTTLEAVTGSVGIMTRGLTTNAKEFKALGVETKNVDGTFKSTTEIFNKTVEQLAAMTDETQRDQLAFKLLGRGAQSLIPILKSGADGIAGMKDEAHKLGIIVGSETIARADQLGDAFDALKSASKSFGANLVDFLSPALISITQGLANFLKGMNNAKTAVDDINKALAGSTEAGVLKNAADAIGKQIEAAQGRLAQAQRGGPTAVAAVQEDILRLEKQRAEVNQQLLNILKQQDRVVSSTKTVVVAAAVDQKAAAEAATKAEQEFLDTLYNTLSLTVELEAIQAKLNKDWADRATIYPAIMDADEQLAEQGAERQIRFAATVKTGTDNLQKMAEKAKETADTISKELVGAFAGFGEAIVKGEDPMKAFFKLLINSLGDAVLAYSAAVEATGWFPVFNPAAIIEGIALGIAGGAIKAGAALMAEGGVVMPQKGGVHALIAEAGQAEAVIPLDRLDRMLETAGSGSTGGGMSHIVVNLDSRALLDTIFDATKNRTVLIDGGAVV